MKLDLEFKNRMTMGMGVNFRTWSSTREMGPALDSFNQGMEVEWDRSLALLADVLSILDYYADIAVYFT